MKPGKYLEWASEASFKSGSWKAFFIPANRKGALHRWASVMEGIDLRPQLQVQIFNYKATADMEREYITALTMIHSV